MNKKGNPYFYFKPDLCAIEHSTKNNQVSIFYTHLVKRKNVVVLEYSSKFDSIRDFVKSDKKKKYVTLALNDNQILTKRIESTISDPLKLVQKAFSNININDFFYQINSFTTSHVISVCRKKHLYDVLDLYKKESISIKSITLGITSVFSIIDYIDTNKIYASNFEIDLKNKVPFNIKKNQDPISEFYNVNGIEVDTTNVLAFSSAMLDILDSPNALTNLHELQKTLYENCWHQRFFAFFVKFVLCFLLCILAINFVVFNHYFNCTNELRLSTESVLLDKKDIEVYRKKLKDTHRKVDGLLNTSPSKSSYFINALITNLPNIISLSEIQFQPLVGKIKTDNEVIVDENTLILSGESSDKELFSKWIYLMESMEWVVSVQIINYEDIEGFRSSFSIKLNCRYDI